MGAAVSSRPLGMQSRLVFTLMAICTGSLFVNSIASYAVCDWVDLRVASFPAKLIAASALLYFIPVATLSALTPVCVGFYDRRRLAAGRSSGLLNGVSAIGNIAGVILSAFVLIPSFGVRRLLNSWWISSIIVQIALWAVLYWRSEESPSRSSESVPLT